MYSAIKTKFLRKRKRDTQRSDSQVSERGCESVLAAANCGIQTTKEIKAALKCDSLEKLKNGQEKKKE